MKTVIELKDIVKKYTMGDSTVYALDHINVQVGFGEFTSGLLIPWGVMSKSTAVMPHCLSLFR